MRGVIRTSACSISFRLSTDGALLSRCSRVVFCCLPPWRGPTSPSSRDLTGLFFFRSGLAFKPRSVGICGGAGGRSECVWLLVGAFEVCPLPRVAISSHKLFPLEPMLSTSSSEEPSEQAITIGGASITEFLSGSPSASKSSIKGAFGISSSK